MDSIKNPIDIRLEKESSINNIINNKNRFGQKSKNMFFVRHAAVPQHLKTIIGIGGIHYRAIKEDFLISNPPNTPLTENNSNSESNFINNPKYDINFNTKDNQDLINSYQTRLIPKSRKQIILPPIPYLPSHYVIVDDTTKWRQELKQLGKRIGIMTKEEIKNEAGRFADTNDQTSLNFNSKQSQKSSCNNRNSVETFNMDLSIENGKYKILNSSEAEIETEQISKNPKTGRFNETRTSSRKNVSRRAKTSLILCDEENEREIWLLQILCQILNTESMQEIQSWLVSSGFNEKEAMRELILKAINGLNKSGRFEINNVSNKKDNRLTVDFDQINSTINCFIDNRKSIDITLNEFKSKNQKEELRSATNSSSSSRSLISLENKKEMITNDVKPNSSHIKQLKHLESKMDKKRDNTFKEFLNYSSFKSHSLHNFKENNINKITEETPSLLNFVDSKASNDIKNEIRLKLNIYDAIDKLKDEKSSFNNKNNFSITTNGRKKLSIYSQQTESVNPNKKVNLQHNSGKISEVLTLE